MPLVFPRGSFCALKFLERSDEKFTRYAGEYRRMKCRTTFNSHQLEPLKSAAVCNAIVRMCPLSFHMWDHCRFMRHWDQISSLQRSLPCIDIHEPENHRRPNTSPGCLDAAHLLATVHLCRPPKRWEEELQHALLYHHHPMVVASSACVCVINNYKMCEGCCSWDWWIICGVWWFSFLIDGLQAARRMARRTPLTKTKRRWSRLHGQQMDHQMSQSTRIGSCFPIVMVSLHLILSHCISSPLRTEPP
jgi:hypothetical protein